MKSRKLILKVHLYGGLLCFWYLILFAVSSLHFHHHFDFMQERSVEPESQQIHLPVKLSADNDELAINIQNGLNISGNHLPWKTNRDSTGVFYTQIENMKTRYHIKYESLSSTAFVTKTDKGLWSVFNALHGLYEKMPNAPFLIFWRIYTYICLSVVVFSAISGIWLWATRGREKFIGWIIVFVIMALSMTLMITVYLRG